MADFKTHVTYSSVLGCGYALAGMTAGIDTSSALVAGGLCGLSGMLPDVDSDSGIPRRETMSFAAAIVPMLLVSRFREMGFSYDEMVLSTAALYFGIRFGLSRLIGEFSVHRGMWHSVPAALIFAGVAFLITGIEDERLKYFKALAVFLGTMSHLVLDEVYSVDTRGVVPKFKKSFGTAVKFWGKKPWANFSTYAKLAVVAVLIFGDMSLLEKLRDDRPAVEQFVQGVNQHIKALSPGNSRPSPQPNSPTQQTNAPVAWGPSQPAAPPVTYQPNQNWQPVYPPAGYPPQQPNANRPGNGFQR